jgi:hypothetical protein
MAIAGLKEQSDTDRLLDAKRILELANKAYFLYVTRKPAEQAELLRKVLLNDRCCKSHAYLQKALRPDLSKGEK